MTTPRRNLGNKTTDAEKAAAHKLGDFLRARREALGYSRAQVAKRTGIAEPTIESYERRGIRMPVDRALIFARFYRVSLEELAEVFAKPEHLGRSPHRDFAEARNRLGYSIGEMSDHLGVSPAAVRAWELGEDEIPVEVVEQLAEHVDAGSNLAE